MFRAARPLSVHGHEEATSGAAARRKGKYTGGTPILGYDAVDWRLGLNEREAKLVRQIFEGFIPLGSATELARELNAEGQTTKCWKNRNGEVRGGRRWTTKAGVYRVLGNRNYLGEVEHQGEVLEGRARGDRAAKALGPGAQHPGREPSGRPGEPDAGLFTSVYRRLSGGRVVRW